MIKFSSNAFRDCLIKFTKIDQANPAILASLNIRRNQIISRKLYFEIKSNLEESVVSGFIPTEDYNRYIPYWCSNRESSLCFGVKVIHDSVHRYLHIKFEDNASVLNLDKELISPRLLKVPFISKKTGISFEYGSDSRVKKNYFYFHTPVEKELVSKKFNVSSDVDHFEYTEIGDTNKLISIYTKENMNNLHQYLNVLNNPLINNLINEFNNSYGISPSLMGVYGGGEIVALYWSFTGNQAKLFKLCGL